MHNAAFAEIGLAWLYVKLPVSPALFEETVRALPASGYRGANVTIPHKLAALAVADHATEAARGVGAANTLTFAEDGAIEAENTDAGGFLDALGTSPRGRTALVLGAGGAARAVAWALREEETARVEVWNRTHDRARDLARDLDVDAVERPAAADIVVNATSVGLDPGVSARCVRRARPRRAGSTGGRGRPGLREGRDARPRLGRARGGAARRRPGGAGPPGGPQLRALDAANGATRGHARGRSRSLTLGLRKPGSQRVRKPAQLLRATVDTGAMAISRPLLLVLVAALGLLAVTTALRVLGSGDSSAATQSISSSRPKAARRPRTRPRVTNRDRPPTSRPPRRSPRRPSPPTLRPVS